MAGSFVCLALFAHVIRAQARGGTPQDRQSSAGQPRRQSLSRHPGLGAAIEGRPWGGSNGVAIDRDGKTVWATDRCSPGTAPGCLGTKANPVHHFDESGKEIRSFGGGMFVWPHGIHVDRDGNVWVTDARAPSADDLKKFPGEAKQGQRRRQVQSRRQGPDDAGQTGREGKSSRSADRPDRRRHRPGQRRRLRGREPYRRDGSRLWSGASRCSTRTASSCGPSARREPGRASSGRRTRSSSIRKGRLIVADRHNHRIQILTKDGKFVGEYDDFGRVSGLAIDKNDVIYTADSESTERVHPGWLRGIRIGSLKDGKVTMFIPPHKTDSPDGAMGEGIAIDAAGNIYTAEATLRGVTKYVKK